MHLPDCPSRCKALQLTVLSGMSISEVPRTAEVEGTSAEGFQWYSDLKNASHL